MAQNVCNNKKIDDENSLTESCRVCINRNSNMKPLFDATNSELLDKITFCTGVVRKIHLPSGDQFRNDDGYPTQICKSCLRNLSIAHKFKTTCLQSDEIIQKYICKVKIEPLDGAEEFIDDVIDFDDEKFNTDDCDMKRDNNESELPSDVVDDQSIKENEIKQTQIRVKKFKFRKLFCESCNIKFENKKESDEHRRRVHSEKVGWVCEICGKNFIHRASLHTHVRSHLPPQHACDACDYRTTNKYDLVKHLHTHTGDKRYKCSLCPSSYRTASNLKEHTRRQHERVRRFVCPRDGCGRPFSDRSKLNRHIDSHDDVKRHVCGVCHAAFSRRCYWKKHMQRQHNVEVPRTRPGRHKENFLLDTRDHVT